MQLRALWWCSAVVHALVAPTPRPISLSQYLVESSARDPQLRDLEPLIASVEMACKTIASLIATAPLDGLTGLAAGGASVNVQGEAQKTLDLVTNDVLKDALAYSGRVGLAASEEETRAMLMDAFDSEYVAVFDPLDGSSNVDAAVATGTIFGVFRATGDCVAYAPGEDDAALGALEARCLGNALQPGANLVAAGYCMSFFFPRRTRRRETAGGAAFPRKRYSSSTVLVLTLGRGVHEFTLDPRSGAFRRSRANVTIPRSGATYEAASTSTSRRNPTTSDFGSDFEISSSR